MFISLKRKKLSCLGLSYLCSNYIMYVSIMFPFYIYLYVLKNVYFEKISPNISSGISAISGSLLDRKKANTRNPLALDLASDSPWWITGNSVIFKRPSAEIKTCALTAMFLCYIRECKRQVWAENNDPLAMCWYQGILSTFFQLTEPSQI